MKSISVLILLLCVISMCASEATTTAMVTTETPGKNGSDKFFFDFFSKFTPSTTQATSVASTSLPVVTTNSTTVAPISCMCGKGAKPKSRIDENNIVDANQNVSDSKIVHGVVSNPHAWPWVAALVNTSSKSLRATCGGSLINNEYVLTAGHCVQDIRSNFKQMKIFLGTNLIKSTNVTKPVVFNISSIKLHPKYNLSIPSNIPHDFDIALIHLASPVTFNSSISPICLSQTGKPFIGKNVTVVGWGDLFNQQNKGSNSLREVSLTVIGNAACVKKYNSNNQSLTLTEEMMCAVGTPPNKGSCQGDSGGPLMLKKPTANTYTLIGIVSFGFECERTGAPPVFARVSRFINFIKAATRNSTYCSNTFFP